MATRIVQPPNLPKPERRYRKDKFSTQLRKSGLRKCSESMRNKLEIYKDKRAAFLQNHTCDFPSEPFGHCFKLASDVHHTAGRKANLLNEDTWLGLCREHHTWVHENAREARKMGLLK